MASRQDIEAGRAFVRLYVKNAEFEKGMKDAKKLLGDFADSLKNVGKALLGLGVSGAGGVIFTGNKFAQFDDALRAARAASGFTAAEMGRLSDMALELANSLGYLPVEVANLTAVLARADLRITELPEATKAVLNMARATGTDAVIAGDLFAATYRMFKKEVKDIPHVVDAMTLAANRSIIQLQNLGDSLKYSGPQAAQFGMSMEDTIAITAALGRIGIMGESAGTALRRLTVDAAGDSARLKAILGVDFTDAAGNMRPLLDSLEDLHLQMKGMPMNVAAAKLKDAFEILGITPATALMQSTMSVKELKKEIEGASGVAKKGADIINGGLGGAFRRIVALVDTVSIKLGEVFSSEIMDAITSISKFLTKVIDFIKTNKEFIVSLGKGAFLVTFVGAAILGIGTAIRFAQYGVSGFLSIFNLTLGVLKLFDVPASRIMRSARLMSAGLGSAFSFMNDKANIFIKNMQSAVGSLASTAGAALTRVLRGAVLMLLKLPSVASSAASGLKTALLSTASVARQFWMGLTGTSRGMVGGLQLLFRGLGAQLRALGSALYFNLPILLRSAAAFSSFAAGVRNTLIAIKYFTIGLTGITYNLMALRGMPRLFALLGAGVRYHFVRMNRAVFDGLNGVRMSFRIFFVALRGLPIATLMAGMVGPAVWAQMTAFQRVVWTAGARINYAIRSYIIAPLAAIANRSGLSAATVAVWNFARSSATAIRLFGLALSGVRMPITAFYRLSAVQQLVWTLGAQLHHRYVRHVITGFRAIKAIGVEVFRVIWQVARITATMTRMAWTVLGPAIARALRFSITTAFSTIAMAGRTAAMAVATSFRAAMGGFSAVVSLLSMVLGGISGPIGTIAMVVPSILMLAPSLFGLLNPMGLLIIALGAGAIYWFRFTESGKAALEQLKAVIMPFVEIGKQMFSGIKDALESGDLALAGKIAMAGLKAIFFEGMDQLASGVGGIFGGAIGTIADKLLKGDLVGAWSTTLETLTALWDLWVTGVFEMFSGVVNSVADKWAGLVDKMANKILDWAGEGGIVGGALSAILGVDVAAEKARMERLNAEARNKGLATTDTDKLGREAIAAQTGATKASIAAYLAKLRSDAEATAQDSAEDLATISAGGVAKASAASMAAKGELGSLLVEARTKAEEVRKRKADEEAAAGKYSSEEDYTAAGGTTPGLGTDTSKFAETATFSAYAAMASSTRQYNIASEHLRVAKETKATMGDMKDTLDKIAGPIGGFINSAQYGQV